MRKTKREYFANIKINNIADNKKFWQTVKPLFSDKINHRETINLIDNKVTLSNDEEIAETLNKYFCNIAKDLSLPENPSINEPSVELFTDPVILGLEKYKDHPSITSIKNKMIIQILSIRPELCGNCVARNYAETMSFHKISTPGN